MPCAFNTSIHDPNSQEALDLPENVLIPLKKPNPKDENINNKQIDQRNIRFNEEYKFMKNISISLEFYIWIKNII